MHTHQCPYCGTIWDHVDLDCTESGEYDCDDCASILIREEEKDY